MRRGGGGVLRAGMGILFFFLHFAKDIIQGFVEFCIPGAGTEGEVMLGAHEAGEGGEGVGDGTQEDDALLEGLSLATQLDGAADLDAKESDLIGETGELGGIEIGALGRVELAGIEAVLEGVDVAGLTATFFGCGRRGSGISIGHS